MTEIARLRELLAEALPGPLTIEPHGPGEAVYLGRGPNRHGYNVAHVTEPAHQWPETRALIVAAVNALPSLLGRLEAAEAVVEAAREVSAALVDGADTGGRYWRACDALNAALAAALAEVDRLRAELCDVLAERDAMQSMATQNGRERNRAEAEAERLTLERDAALENTRTMVAALDDLASANAEVERLTRERDEAHATLGDLHAQWAAVTSDRDRLAATLAEVREAAEALVECVDAIDGDALRYGLGPALDAADTVRNLASTPADLAAAHDARIAESVRERCARLVDWHADHDPDLSALADAMRSIPLDEAERIGGGR